MTFNDFAPPFALRAPCLAACLAASLACASPLVAAQAPPAANASASQAMSLTELLSRLRSSNRSILAKKAEADITATGIGRADAAFQPQLNVGAVQGVSKQKNTFEEELIRQNLGIYEREGKDYTVGISTVLPQTGMKFEVKSVLSRFITNNNRSDPLRPPGAMDNRATTGFSLTQPLARDAGPEVTLAKLNISRMDAQAAELATRDTETSIVAEAMMAYYELVFAQQRVEAAQDKIRTSTSLLREAEALRRQGRLPQTDVWEVENAMTRYQAALSEALQNQRERSNRLRVMLMMEASPAVLKATDPLPGVDDRPVDLAQSLQVALSKRDDYQMRKVQVEREGLQVAYAKNQGLPRVDLVASYGLNGLEYQSRQALDLKRARDFPSWTLGVQLSVPLGANMQADADLRAATVRREDAVMALKAIEGQIAVDIDTSLAMRSSMLERWKLWQQVAEREVQQLAAERLKFTAGRSDTRELLLRQERVTNARLSVLEQQVGYARAHTLLQAAQGVLMERVR